MDEVVEEGDVQVRRDDQLFAPTNGHQQQNVGDPRQPTKVCSDIFLSVQGFDSTSAFGLFKSFFGTQHMVNTSQVQQSVPDLQP